MIVNDGRRDVNVLTEDRCCRVDGNAVRTSKHGNVSTES